MSLRFCEKCGKPIIVLIDEVMGQTVECTGCGERTDKPYGDSIDSMDRRKEKRG